MGNDFTLRKLLMTLKEDAQVRIGTEEGNRWIILGTAIEVLTQNFGVPTDNYLLLIDRKVTGFWFDDEGRPQRGARCELKPAACITVSGRENGKF